MRYSPERGFIVPEEDKVIPVIKKEKSKSEFQLKPQKRKRVSENVEYKPELHARAPMEFSGENVGSVKEAEVSDVVRMLEGRDSKYRGRDKNSKARRKEIPRDTIRNMKVL